MYVEMDAAVSPLAYSLPPASMLETAGKQDEVGMGERVETALSSSSSGCWCGR